MTDTPQVLLAHHLKTLKLPTFLREYDKMVPVQQLCEGDARFGSTVRLRRLHHASARFQATPVGNRGVGPSLRSSMNCPLRIRWMSSIPAIVLAALAKVLKPNIGPARALIARWSCSTMLFR